MMAEHCCGGHGAVAPSVHQTMDEMEFERGVWAAAVDGDMTRLGDLLDSGIEPDITDSSGYTALHYGARNGQTEVCRLLLDRGADVNCRTRSGGVTPLHRAAFMGYSTVVQLLMQRGADVTAVDNDSKTALHKAAERGHELVCEMLVEADSSLISKADNRGHCACDCLPQCVTDDLKQLLSNHP